MSKVDELATVKSDILVHVYKLMLEIATIFDKFQTWKRNWQVDNKLGNRALKSNLKTTINFNPGLTLTRH